MRRLHRRRLECVRSTSALVALWAIVSLAFLVVLATEVLGRRATVVVDDYAATLAPGIAGLACLGARRRATGRARRGWLLLALSTLSWAAGGLAWTVYEVHLGREIPFPSVADVGYLGSVPLAVAALLCFPGHRVSGLARLRPALDGVIASGALLFVSWVTVLGPAFYAGEGPVLSQAISLAYPAGDVLTATIALLALARARGEQRQTMGMIGAGLLIVAVADSSFTWFTTHGTYVTGNLFDTGYIAGFLLIGLAALRSTSWIGGDDDIDPAPSGRLALVLPYLPLLVGVPFAATLQFREGTVDALAFVVGLVVVVAVLLRQSYGLQANLTLSRRLHDTVNVLRHREIELNHRAFHDPLTGLANRALLSDRIGQALTRRRGEPVLLLLADLDDFKVVNDTLGHPAGDALLVAVAERLLTVIRPEDTVARLGGDEFAVLLEAPGSVADAQRVADRIAQALMVPFELSGMPTVIAASIGIAAGRSLHDGDALLRDADIAMYAAKAQGKGGYVIYAVELATAILGRMQLKGDLANALSRGELSLKYQPIVELATGHLTGIEALLRWTHPVQGIVLPTSFIADGEASGALVPIGHWVLQQACAQAGRWQLDRLAGEPALQLHVNMSNCQLSDPLLLPVVRAALSDAGLAPQSLTLEITDSVLLDDDATVKAHLMALREFGVRLAIDRFGTGHSRLSRLRRYPVDTLKVDRSFIAELTAGASAPDVLITAILALGEGLGMTIIAEGVENEDQLAALRVLGCPQAQGFLFARPADPEVIGELIRARITLTDPATSVR